MARCASGFATGVVLSFAVVVTVAVAPTVALGAFPGANGKIAYTLAYGGDVPSIHTVFRSGADNRMLASGFDPAWSADGTRMAFARVIGRDCGKSECPADIFTMRADGSDLRRLTNTSWSESNPAYSPNGRRIVFDRTRDSGLGDKATWIVSVRSADGSDPRRLAGNRRFRGNIYPGSFDPEYAPDGRRIVYVAVQGGSSPPAKPGIYTMRPDGSHKRLLASAPLQYATRLSSPDYSPDGRHIVFQRYVKKWGIVGTEVMRSDGSNRKALPCGEVAGPVYSPNGQLFAASLGEVSLGNIVTTDTDFASGFCSWTPATRYGEGYFASEPSWQPLPGG